RDTTRAMVGRSGSLAGAFLDGVRVGLLGAAGHQVDAHGNPAAFTRQDERVRLGRDTGHTNRRMRLLIGFEVQLQTDLVYRFGDGKPPVLVFVDAWLRVAPEL